MKYVIILVMLFCVGCSNRGLDFADENIEYLSEFIVNVKERLEKLEDKSLELENKRKISQIIRQDNTDRLDNMKIAYDPNAPELKFLGATDPNWARDFGDTRETRELYNICLNRGLINRDRLVLAEACKRLLAIEAWQKEITKPVDIQLTNPNEVKE